MIYSEHSPPMGAANVQATPVAAAAASISLFLDSFYRQWSDAIEEKHQ